MDRKEIIENIEAMNEIRCKTLELVKDYMGETYDNADEEDLYCLLGAQSSYLYNTVSLALKYANVDSLDRIVLGGLKDALENQINGCIQKLGKEPLCESEGVSDEDILEFAKECGLTKRETEVLKKIVDGKGNPTDMTEEDKKIALRMSGKIESSFSELCD